MPYRGLLALSVLALLFAAGCLLTGCGYERNPIRVHWHLQTTPPSPVAPEDLLTYALDISPPWADPGTLLLSIPDSIHVDSGALTLFGSHDLAFVIACPNCVDPTLFTGPAGSKTVRCTVCSAELPVMSSYIRQVLWKIANDERSATLDLDSPSAPGVHLRIDLKVDGPRMDFSLTITNNTKQDLRNLSADFFYGTGQIQVSPAPSYTFPSTNDSRAIAIASLTSGNRKFLISWQPGKTIPSPNETGFHINPVLGDLPAGKSVHAAGLILFSKGSADALLKEALKPPK